MASRPDPQHRSRRALIVRPIVTVSQESASSIASVAGATPTVLAPAETAAVMFVDGDTESLEPALGPLLDRERLVVEIAYTDAGEGRKVASQVVLTREWMGRGTIRLHKEGYREYHEPGGLWQRDHLRPWHISQVRPLVPPEHTVHAT
jgi:hypothetical protein